MSMTVHLEKAVTINRTGGVLLEDFAMLDGWKIWDGAWGGKASFQSADSVPPGATGAIQGHFPGILYKELTEAQARDCDVWNHQAGL